MKFKFIAAAALLVTAVSCYNDAELRERVTALEQQVPASVTALQKSIANLEAVDTAIQLDIDALEAELEEMDASVDSTKARINEIKDDIALLQAKDKSLQKELSSLKEDLVYYMEARLDSFLEYAATRFATAERIDSVATDLEELKQELSTVSKNLNDKIENSISSLKSWVKETLNEYYKAAEVDEITDALTTRLDSLSVKVDNLSSNVTKLLERIQSLTFVPRYSDGNATAWYSYDGEYYTAGKDTIDFKILPSGIAKKLAGQEGVITAEAVYTRTRSDLTPTALTVSGISASGDILTVVFSGSALDNSFYTGKKGASACITISDGNNNRASNYVTLIPKASSYVVPVTGIELNKTSLSMTVGESFTLEATVKPSDATDKSVSWLSTGTGISLTPNNSSALIEAKSAGSATVTAKCGNKSVSCTVTITEAPQAE